MYSENPLPSTTPDAAQSPVVLTAADALAWLEAQPGLRKVPKANRRSALAALVRALAPAGMAPGSRAELRRTAALVPLDCATVRRAFYDRPFHELGLPSKRRRDAVVSLLRGVLSDMGVRDPDLPPAGDLAPAWAALHAQLSPERQKGLIGFMGWCSVQGLAPEAVTDATLAAFESWSVDHVVHRNPHGRARRTASNWNWAGQYVPGWPAGRLTRVGMRDDYALPWEAYAPALREDRDRFLDRLRQGGDGDIADAAFGEDPVPGQPASPPTLQRGLRPRTVSTRQDCLKVALAALVAAGHAPETLRLADLVQPPTNVKVILGFHRKRAWDRRVSGLAPEEAASVRQRDIRTSGLVNIAETLRQLARFHFRLPEAEVAQIGTWVGMVKPCQQMSMSEKNRRRLGALVQPEAYARLLVLPRRMMWQAGQPGQRPRAAALLGMYAAAMEILTIFPIRRVNLASLRLDRHLRRESEGGPVCEIFISGEEVKNGEMLQCPVPPASAELLERYLRTFRPALAEPDNPFLFPGGGQRARSAHDLAVGLKEIVEPEIGVAFNLHMMRHLAVYRFLKACPGQHEVARRLLGHRKTETTRAFYSGLETVFAGKAFVDLVEQERSRAPRPPAGWRH